MAITSVVELDPGHSERAGGVERYEDAALFIVVVNHEEQYSIWPSERQIQNGCAQSGSRDLASDLRRPGRRGPGRLRPPDRRVGRAAGRELRADRHDRHAPPERTLDAASFAAAGGHAAPNSELLVGSERMVEPVMLEGTAGTDGLRSTRAQVLPEPGTHTAQIRGARPCAVVTSMRAQLVGSSYRVFHRHRPGVAAKVVASRSPGYFCPPTSIISPGFRLNSWVPLCPTVRESKGQATSRSPHRAQRCWPSFSEPRTCARTSVHSTSSQGC
jgi:hypothetical protein